MTWASVGFATVALDFLLFFMLVKITDSVLFSNLISIALSSSFNFLLHQKKTFPSDSGRNKQVWRYLIYQLLVWVFSTMLILFLFQCGMSSSASKILPLVVFIPINFKILKNWVYSHG